MPFYTGKSRDGSDMVEFEGFYVSPNGLFWGTEPISREQEEEMFQQFHKPKTRKERRKIK